VLRNGVDHLLSKIGPEASIRSLAHGQRRRLSLPVTEMRNVLKAYR
jgi:hypothetical protein